MAVNISSNFSCPLISKATELSWEKVTPSSLSWLTRSESLVCATAETTDSQHVATATHRKITSFTL